MENGPMSFMEERQRICKYCGLEYTEWEHGCYLTQLNQRLKRKNTKRKKKRGQMTWTEEKELGL